MLVVDDDDVSRHIAAQVLRDSGHTVVEASGPYQALDIAADPGQPIDLLVTDVMMPGMRGPELAALLAGDRPGLPVLTVSGAAEPEEPSPLAPGRGPSAFLAKPFFAVELLSAITALTSARPLPAPGPTPEAATLSAVLGPSSTVETTSLAATATIDSAEGRLQRFLPMGRGLPTAEWDRRHSVLVAILCFHAVALTITGVALSGFSLHAFEHGALIAGFAAVAFLNRGQHIRELAVTFGLLTCSALIVHLSGGVIEAHFHYFVVIVLLSLYESWRPFLIAIGYVLVQHGAMAVIDTVAVYDHDGSAWFWAAVHATAVALTSAGLALTWRFNDEARRTEARVRSRLAYQAGHDDLTGLPNRRLLLEELERASALCLGGRPGAAVLFVDVDNFKTVNDSLGHTIGDRLLADIADRLRHALRNEDLIARAGGDEFVVLARSARTDEDAVDVAARILAAVEAPFEVGGTARRVGVSIGIARFGADTGTVADALARANVAMHRAKQDGRGRFRLADDDMLDQTRRRMEIDTALDESTREQFSLHFQPIVDLADGSIPAVEALLRWHHPVLGHVSPGEFIPIAEANGHVVEIGRWALEMAATQGLEWEHGLDRPLKVFVNVAASQLTHPDFVDMLEGVLSLDSASGNVALELTETSLVDGVIPPATLAALQRAGIDLVLDDFGTGFSSLDYLARFPLSLVKLDRSFVVGCVHDPSGSVVLDAVVNLARGLGFPALAEGIETAEQLGEVRARGYALGQGYLFARPCPPADLEELLAHPNPFAEMVLATGPGLPRAA